MKRRILLFLTVLALAACFFAVTVGASDIYSDFTQNGANGESPIFNLRGYSVNELGGSICAEYDVNVKALKSYEEATGISLEFGVVVTRVGNLVDGKPFDENGNTVGVDGDKVYKADLSTLENTLITLILHGLDTNQYDEKIVMCLYVNDGSSIKYITGEASSETPDAVSYNSVLEDLESGNTPDGEEPDAPVVPPVDPDPDETRLTEVTIGGITYAIDGVTEPAWDRIRQMNNSEADYDIGSSASMSTIKGKANLIIIGGSILGMPKAAELMSHYLKNTGANYNLDVAKFMSDDSGAKSSRNKAINNALRAAEQLAVEGEFITIGQLTEGHPMQNSLATQNWQYALGSYFDDVDVINLTVTEENGVKTYTADIKYIVVDFYNWDTNDYSKFKQIVSPHDLHELHRGGVAKEFLTYGEATYSSITWTEGQDVSTISAFK